MPDLTFILDVPAKVGLARAKRRRGKGAADRFEAESVEFHEALRKAYRALADKEPKRCVVIDGRAPRDVVAERIWAAVAQRLQSGSRSVGGARSRRERRRRRRGDVLRAARNRRAVRPRRGRARAARELPRRPHSARLADRRASWHRQGDAGLSSGALRARASRSAGAAVQKATSLAVDAGPSGRAPHRRAGARRPAGAGARHQREDRQAVTPKSASTTCGAAVAFFGSTAGEGGWRIAIVDAVDELQREGANALAQGAGGAAGARACCCW